MRNGLANLKLHPDKINLLLKSSPFKLIEGSISEVKLNIDPKNMKVEVIVGKIKVVVYVDDHSQFANFKDEESEDTSKDSSLMEKILSSFELGLSLQSLDVEIRLERPDRQCSKFTLNLEKLLVKKLKQTSSAFIHSITASLSKIEMGYQQIGDSTERKMLTMNRIKRIREPQSTTEAIQVSIDMPKVKDEKKKIVVRGSLGSIQSALTINSCFDLMRLGNKVMEFMDRQMFVQQGLASILEGASRDSHLGNDRELNEQNDDLYDLPEDQFKSFRANNNQSLFMSLNQSFNMAASFYGGHPPTQEDANKLSSSIIDLKAELMESILDIDLSLQGVYVAFLKEPVFETSHIFSWPKEVEKNHKLDFHEILCSYFLLRVEDVSIAFNPAANSKVVSIGSVEFLDFEFQFAENAASKKDIGLFSNRVVIQGIDDSSNNLDNSQNLEDSFSNFKTIAFPSFASRYKEQLLLSIDKLPKDKSELDKPAVSVRMTLQNISPLTMALGVGLIHINLDIECFKVMNNRKLFFEEIIRVGQLLNDEKRKGQHDMFRHQESLKYFGGCLTSDMRLILAEVESIAHKITTSETFRERVIRLFELPDLMKVSRESCPKINLDIAGMKIRTGGTLGEKSTESAWLNITMGAAHILLHQQIVISWKNNIDVSIEGPNKASMLFLSVIGDKENLIGIDKSMMIVKITAIDIRLSPPIFEYLLLFINVVNNRLIRSQFYIEKYQVMKSLLEQQEIANKVYKIFEEESGISKALSEINLALLRAPELVSKVYFYLGRLSLQVFDEQITREIIESSIAQRRRILEDHDDEFTVVNMDMSTSQTSSGVEKEVEALEARLQLDPVVIHLELKPIMARVELSSNNLTVLCHTILLRDGLTYLCAKDKRDYQTQFIELMSINHNQPVYDARLGRETFDIVSSIGHFKQVMNKFTKQAPFVQVTKTESFDPATHEVVDHTKVAVSSIILRLANQTSKETFLCLIRLVDDTLVRLDRIAQVMAKSREELETDDIKMYRRRQEEISEREAASKVSTKISKVSLNLDSIYVDIFNPMNYRVVLKITSTSFSMDDDIRSGQPMSLNCKLIGVNYAVKKEMTVPRNIDTLDNNEHFFKLISLQALNFSMKEEVVVMDKDRVPTQYIMINMPSEEDKNFFVLMDIESLSILLQISSNLEILLAAAKSKSQFLFKDLTERRAKNPEVKDICDDKEFEPVGIKYQEMKSVKDHFEQIKGTKEFSIEDESNTSIVTKLDIAHHAIDDIYIEQLSSDRRSMVVRLWVDKIKVNIYQRYEAEGEHSYISLKLKETLVAARINTSQDCRKPTIKTVTTSSAVVSIGSLKVLDRTKGSMFKNLVKIPKHSMCFYARSREVAEHTLDTSSLKPKTIIESYLDKIAFILELQPIQIWIDDKSVSSLTEFAYNLADILKNTSSSSQPHNPVIASPTAQLAESKFLLDYISVDKISVELMSRSSTNISLANFIPDLNINLSEKYYELEAPVTQTELTNKFLNDIKQDLSKLNLLKDNIKNVPLLASFVSLVGSLGTIYSAVTNRDGRGVLIGIRDIGLLVLVSVVKTGQFGLKSIADLTKLLGTNISGGLLDGWKDVNHVFEKLVLKISGGSTGDLKESKRGGSSKRKNK